MTGPVTLYLSFIVNIGEQKDEPKSFEASGPIIKVSKVDYESLPSYMKSLAPWEVWSLCDETAWREVYVMKLVYLSDAFPKIEIPWIICAGVQEMAFAFGFGNIR